MAILTVVKNEAEKGIGSVGYWESTFTNKVINKNITEKVTYE